MHDAGVLRGINMQDARRRPDNVAHGPDYASGVADGVSCRARSESPSKFLMVAIDNYASGYRAGYFAREPQAAALQRVRRTG
jgi:hypothetical protein